MLLCDVNVFVYAMRADSAHHVRFKAWLEAALSGEERVGVSELALSAAVRIVTNHRIFTEVSSPVEALDFCDSVLAAPAALPVRSGVRHWEIFAQLVRRQRLRGNEVPDAYFAALALEHDATWVTRDQGFSRYPGLRLLDPSTD